MAALVADVPALPAAFSVAGFDDVLVFSQSDAGFALIGGSGRGVGWAGIVDLEPADDSLVGRAWQAGTTARQASARARHVAGPYHARHAVAVPVGARYVVVFGSHRPIRLADSQIVRAAVDAVDRIHGVPADKLLADELELVHAVRLLMAYKADNVRDTAHHIATIAARALSCDVALIRVDVEGQLTQAVDVRGAHPLVAGPGADAYLSDAASGLSPLVDQAAQSGAGEGTFGLPIASSMVIRLGSDPSLGALALGHSSSRPRGFTSLCQRIGRALSEAAELLISQAIAREQLAAEFDLLARISGTDALTGIANRRRWDESAQAMLADSHSQQAMVLSCDLDGLKAVNDRFGHAAGDALIRATANLLTTCVRGSDLVARIGGDEFAVLLRGSDAKAATLVRRRVRRAEHGRWVTEHGLRVRLSFGLAEVHGNDVAAAHARADQLMYANKRRRSASAGLTIPSTNEDRRTKRR